MIHFLLSSLIAITFYLPTGSRMANGHWPRPGDAACPPQWDFGQLVLVDGIGLLACGDRYAAWLASPRIDVFLQSEPADRRRYSGEHLYALVEP